MLECKCKEYNKISPNADSYHIVYVADTSETPINCPLCGDKVQFQLPAHISRKQMWMYTDAILRVLKEMREKKQTQRHLDARV